MSTTKRIVNKTQGTVIAERAELANTPLKRLKGLLGRQGLEPGQGMIIVPCSSIHTFFMKFPIDVIFLDKKGAVSALAESLPPSRLFGAWLSGSLVIELPPKTISKTKTQKGNIITIE